LWSWTARNPNVFGLDGWQRRIHDGVGIDGQPPASLHFECPRSISHAEHSVFIAVNSCITINYSLCKLESSSLLTLLLCPLLILGTTPFIDASTQFHSHQTSTVTASSSVSSGSTILIPTRSTAEHLTVLVFAARTALLLCFLLPFGLTFQLEPP
jgi:hypothetical protein